MAVPARRLLQDATLEEAGIVQSMSRKGNCIDNGATEQQVFGHIKDEFFRGQSFESFEEFKGEARGVHRPLEHEAKAG